MQPFRNFRTGTIWEADNLDIMRGINSKTVDLIYLDPPFKKQKPFKSKMSNRTVDRLFEYIDMCREGRDPEFARKAEKYIETLLDKENQIWMSFNDAWYLSDIKKDQLVTLEQNYPDIHKYIQSIPEDDMKAYMIFMAVRLIEMQRILANTGSLYLHCDQDANSYLRVLLDLIFGRSNHRNELVWSYKRWPVHGQDFQRMHDVIFRYSKTNRVVWNQSYEPLSESTLKSHGGYKQEAVFDESGKRIGSATTSEKSKGLPCRAVWSLPVIGPTAKERIGYPTQKPVALLERIIAASSNEGDIVFDPFAGCATAIDAAYNLNRRWLACDKSYMSVILLRMRLEGPGTLLNDYAYKRTETEPPVRTDEVKSNFKIEKNVTISPVMKDIFKRNKFGEQKGKCLGCGKTYEFVSFQMDHVMPKALGGEDEEENFQLLCGPCNRKKRDRPEGECKDWMWKYTNKIYYH